MSRNPEELPEGWVGTTLGAVTVPTKEKVDPSAVPGAIYIGLEHVEAHSMRILGQGVASDVRSAKTVFRAGDVLYGKLRPYLNKVAVPSFDGICSTDFLVFPKSDILDSQFLAKYLNQLRVAEAAHHMSAGVELPRVDWKSLSSLPFPLIPLTEQRRIANRINQFEAKRSSAADHVSAVTTMIRRFRHAVLAAACSGRLSADWREASGNAEDAASRLARHHAENPDIAINRRRMKPAAGLAIPDQSDEFPPEWAYSRVRELVALGVILDVQDGNHGELYPRKGDFVESDGLPYISAESVDEEVQIDRAPRLHSAVASRLRIGFARPGDVILTHNATVGRVAVLPKDSPEVVLSTSTTYYRTDSRVLLPEYLVTFMRSPFFQRQLFAVMEQTTRNQVPVTKQVELFLALPTIDEQRIVVERAVGMLNSANEQLNRVERAAQRLDQSAQAVLGKAFRGGLSSQSEQAVSGETPAEVTR